MLLFPFFLVVASITVWLGHKAGKVKDDYEGFFMTSFIMGVIISLISVGIMGLGTIASYYGQINDIESLKQIDSVSIILKQKSDNLTAEFAGYLAKQYPELEKEIFKSISPDKVNAYLAAYPQIKSSETLMGLVNLINKLQGDYYDQKLKREETLKNIRVRLRDPMIITWVIPKS